MNLTNDKYLNRELFRSVQNHDIRNIHHFLRLGGDPSALLMPEGISSLHYSAGTDDKYAFYMTFLLLLYGGNPNVRCLDGLTPVHVSAAWGHTSILKLLLKYGGDPNVSDYDENTAMSLAVENRHSEIVSILKRSSLPYKLSTDGKGNLPSSYNISESHHSYESERNARKSSSTENMATENKDSCCGCLLESTRITPLEHNLPASNDSSMATWYTVEEYLCVDDRKRVTFIEQQWSPCDSKETDPPNGSSDSTEIYHWSDDNNESRDSLRTTSTKNSVPESLKGMRDNTIVAELKKMGDMPGPITDSTRRIYMRRLHKLRHGNATLALASIKTGPDYSSPLTSALNGALDISTLKDLEAVFLKEFDSVNPSNVFRGGITKLCFNYLLIDPKISQNLPMRANSLNVQECFSTFVSAIFYVGKGQNSRPYDHFYEALKTSNNLQNKTQLKSKIQRILDIWNSDYGVISLHCFHGSIAIEAHSREACLIDAIGLANLTNSKRGEYYGEIIRWSFKDKCKMGVLFLYRALQIFLQEGERQIRPINI